MKTYIIVLIALLISISTFAQQGINYKALIKDDLGNVIANQEIDVIFSIIEATGSTVVYTENHDNIMTDANGIVILNIGEGTTTDDFSAITWGSDKHSLKVEIDLEDDATFEDLGTTEFKAVPYAKHAESANFKTINNVTSNSPGDMDIDDFVFGSTQLDHNQPDEGPIDYRMFFDKSKGAFRAGGTQEYFSIGIYGNVWDESNIGANSFAIGYNTEASGAYSIASGYTSKATGEGSIALGNQLQAAGNYSFSVGTLNKALGNYSVALGYNNDAKSYAETVFGSNNTDYTIEPGGNTSWEENDRLFVLGNGESTSMRSDALIVLKNGVITAPSLTNSLIFSAGDKALITREFFLANSAQRINDLSDGKSDVGGNNNGSSIFLGRLAGFNDDGADNRNSSVGFNTMNNNTTGFKNVAIGHSALESNTTGKTNVANGNSALRINTTGSSNVANGSQALEYNITGSNNVANGSFALWRNTIGSENTANGTDALTKNTSGSNNTAIGRSAGSFNISGNNNVFIGNNAGSTTADQSNKLYINNESSITPLIYGEFDTDVIRINGTTTLNNIASNSNPDLILGGTSINNTNGIIASDPQFSSSDIFIRSNDDVIVYLDADNNDIGGAFKVVNGSGTNVIEVSENGNAQFDGEIQHTSTGNANMIPVAYGSVSATATPLSGIGNFTVTRNALTNEYTISVTGETLSSNNTVVNVSVNTTTFRTSTVTYSGGNAIVHIFASSFAKVASAFQFVIYKE